MAKMQKAIIYKGPGKFAYEERPIPEIKDKNDVKIKNTILEQLGLVFEECDKKDIAIIKDALGSCSDKFYKDMESQKP